VNNHRRRIIIWLAIGNCVFWVVVLLIVLYTAKGNAQSAQPPIDMVGYKCFMASEVQTPDPFLIVQQWHCSFTNVIGDSCKYLATYGWTDIETRIEIRQIIYDCSLYESFLPFVGNKAGSIQPTRTPRPTPTSAPTETP
jgi:hypothetical protein